MAKYDELDRIQVRNGKTGDNSHAAVAKYDELDRILDVVEPVILSLADNHNLKGASIERWRWDEPVITLTWVGSDNISRNIHTLIIMEGSSPSKLKVEVNAWKDEEMVRRWQHKIVGRLPLPPDTSQLQNIVGEGYRVVSQWSKEDLGEHTYLASRTAGP